jgi:hypothetical protein
MTSRHLHRRPACGGQPQWEQAVSEAEFYEAMRVIAVVGATMFVILANWFIGMLLGMLVVGPWMLKKIGASRE